MVLVVEGSQQYLTMRTLNFQGTSCGLATRPIIPKEHRVRPEEQ